MVKKKKNHSIKKHLLSIHNIPDAVLGLRYKIKFIELLRYKRESNSSFNNIYRVTLQLLLVSGNPYKWKGWKK